MTAENLVKVGSKTYCITGAKWDSSRQVGLITFEDDNGITFETESFGMFPSEQRQAVYDEILRQFAAWAGNHPYEDGRT